MPPDCNDERRPLTRSAAQDVVHRDEATVTRPHRPVADLAAQKAYLHWVLADDPRALARRLAWLALDYNDPVAVQVAFLAITETPRVGWWA